MSKNLTELGGWKVGQKVLMWGTGCKADYETICAIDKITDGRGGTIYAGDRLFDITGHQRGNDIWSKLKIKIATETDFNTLRGKIARRRLAKVQWENLDPAKAIEIEKLINANGIETKEKK